MREKNAKCFRKKARSSKPISNDSVFFNFNWGCLGRLLIIHFRIENFIGLKFWGYCFVFLITLFVLFSFCSLFCFCFLLRLKIFICFPLPVFLSAYYLRMLLSWVHLIRPCFSQVWRIAAKITLLMEGSACLYKKKGKRRFKIRSGLEGSGKMVIEMSPAGSAIDAWGMLKT